MLATVSQEMEATSTEIQAPQPSFTEEPGDLERVSRPAHRRTSSFGEFFSSSSKWLVDQFTSNFTSSPTTSRVHASLLESRGEDPNGEDFFSWVLPGSSSPQDLGEYGGGESSEVLNEFALQTESSLLDIMEQNSENMATSVLCGESDDEDEDEGGEEEDESCEWPLNLSGSFKDKFSSWKIQLQQNLASLDRFILGDKKSDTAGVRGEAGELLNPPLTTTFDFEEEGVEFDGAFSYTSLIQRASLFWKETVLADIPQKIEEVNRTASVLYNESISEMELQHGTSTFDRIRTRSLLRAYRTFNEKSNSLLVILRQLIQHDIQPLVREAYEEAVRTSGPSIYQASRIPFQAAQNVKEKVSRLLDSLIGDLEVTEKEMDGALQQVLFVLRSKEEDKRKQEENSLHEDTQFNGCSVALPRKRQRDEGLTSVPIPATPFDELGMSHLFVQDIWERFFSTTSDVAAQYSLLEQQLQTAGLTFCEVKSDSNCQFRALAHQVYGTEDAHPVVRALLVHEISSNHQRYQSLGTNEQLQSYLSALSDGSQRGDCTTLCAAANLYAVEIMIYTPLLIEPLLISPQSGLRQKVLFLSYINDNHYQSLVKEETLLETTSPKSTPRPAKKPKNSSNLEQQLVANLSLLQISHLDTALQHVSNGLIQSVEEVKVEPQCIGDQEASSIESNPDTTGFLSESHPTPVVQPTLASRVPRCAPSSLLHLCLSSIAKSIESFPSLENILPEDLLQKLIKQLVATGKLNDFVLPRLISTSFQTLHLPRCKNLTDVGLSHVISTCSNLQEIDISGCLNVRGQSLVGVGNACPSLRYLDLENCAGIAISSIPEIIKTCSELVFLNLSGTSITDNILSCVLQQCTQLNRLQLRNCAQLTDAGFVGLTGQLQYLDLSDCLISDKTIIRIASRCRELRILKLSACHVSDAAIEILCQSCPHLSSLFLNSCDFISDATVHTISRHCPSLQALSLSFCKKITDNAFQPSPFSPEPQFYNLQFLDLTRCINVSDSSLKQIALRCPNLRILNLSSCEDLTDEGVVMLTSLCSSLEDLDLSKCVNITDTTIDAIAHHCKNLRRLCLYNCNKVTDSSISQLASHCHHLAFLDLSSCENITDNSLVALSKGCQALGTLSLEECQHITDFGISSLAEGCPQLHTLRLAYCKGITDLSLHILSESCPHITSIDLSYCLNLSLPGIQQAIERWTNLVALSLRGNNSLTRDAFKHNTLQSLNLSWCKNLEDVSIASIAQGCPGLQNLDLSWCSKLEGTNILDLSRSCSQLRLVNLKGCNRVPTVTIKSFATESKIKVYH